MKKHSHDSGEEKKLETASAQSQEGLCRSGIKSTQGKTKAAGRQESPTYARTATLQKLSPYHEGN